MDRNYGMMNCITCGIYIYWQAIMALLCENHWIHIYCQGICKKNLVSLILNQTKMISLLASNYLLKGLHPKNHLGECSRVNKPFTFHISYSTCDVTFLKYVISIFQLKPLLDQHPKSYKKLWTIVSRKKM